ncbi:MAG: Tim44-like domain-containing protein [Firmicutes bacterium]|nr:Tim44-like domain-containing protein [Bacillota bacterium]
MKKRFSALAAIPVLAVLLFAAAVCAAVPAIGPRAAAAILPVDVGNNNDYDGGGDWDGGTDWDGGDDWGGAIWDSDSSGSGSSSPGGIIIAVIIIAAVILISARKNSSRGNASAPTRSAPARPASVPGNHEAEIVPAIQVIDPNFSRDAFINWGNEVFITLQQAWTERDWARIRPFEKEELFRQHEMQLQEYINTGRINIIGRVNVRQAYLHRYQRDAQYEYLTVYMETRMSDYIIDEKTQNVVKGDPNRDYFLNYLLTYMRKTGVKTDPAKSNHSTVSCPHCGAPVSVTSAGRCEYCDFIITTGEHDWVLSSLDCVRPNTVLDERGVILLDQQNSDPQA